MALNSSISIFNGYVRHGKSYFFYSCIKLDIESGKTVTLYTYKTKEYIEKTFKDYFDMDIEVEHLLRNTYNLKLKL